MSASSYEPVEFRAESVEEAIEIGLGQLGLKRNEVIIEIIEEENRGILGMGARQAVIRLVPLREPRPPKATEDSPEAPVPDETKEMPAEETSVSQPEEAAPKEDVPPKQAEPAAAPPAGQTEDSEELELAESVVTDLLSHLEYDVNIEIEQAIPSPEEDAANAPWILNIEGDDLGPLIGRRGETLGALQYITRLIVSRQLERRTRFIIDVEGYKNKREDVLRKLANRMAQRALEQGRTVTLEPMPPNERRIIHLTLRDNPDIETESIGDGNQRKVTIKPTQRS